MNKQFIIVTALLLIASFPRCNAMNKDKNIQPARIIKEITIVARPYSVNCFPNDKTS